MIRTLAILELKRLLVTPLGWVTLGLSQFVIAWALLNELDAYAVIQSKLVALESQLGLTTLVVIPALNNSLSILLIIIPLLTMRTFAGDQHSGNLDRLLASPLSPNQLLIGKTLAIFFLFSFFWLLQILVLLSLNNSADLDTGKLLGFGAIGWLALLTAITAGIWFSLLTRHQVIAAISTYVALIFLRLPTRDDSSFYSQFTFTTHLQNSQLGLISANDVAYFALLASAFYLASYVKVSQWRTGIQTLQGRITLALLIIILASSEPLVKKLETFGLDLSDQLQNSLQASTKNVLNSLDQPLSFTVYITENNVQKKQMKQFIQRFKRSYPELIVQYIDPQNKPELAKAMGVTQNGEILVRYNNRQQLISEISESSITDTIIYLAGNNRGWVINLLGHGEDSLFDDSIYGISLLTQALQSRGYKLRDHSLEQFPQLPRNTELVIINSPTTSLTTATSIALSNYLEQGGNLLWLNNTDQFNYPKSDVSLPVIDLLPGTIIDKKALELKLPSVDHLVITHYPGHALTRKITRYTLFTSAKGLKLKNSNQWTLETTLKTNEQTWNETETLNESATRDAIFFEQQGPLIIGALFSKDINQRVAVFGDSDFLRNHLLGKGDNLQLTLNLFHWLTQTEKVQTNIQQPADQLFNPSDKERAFFGLTLLVLLPAMFLLPGLYIPWHRNRKNR